jgi:arabinogalactan endo-1,4-beta-galactosidase
MIRRTFLALVASMLAGAPIAAQEKPPSAFAYGADISWVTEQEAAGLSFRDAQGKPADLYDLVAANGIETIRLRVWVDPAKRWNGREDVLAKARRARDHGMRIMIDFHYSDDWADPGHDVDALTKAVADHTRNTLAYLKADGIDVAWVQVGNEITNGLLWPDGKTDRFDNIARFTNAGYDAVKSVYPAAEVIIHIDNGWDTAKAVGWFDGFTRHGGKVDVIGLSYYPFYTPSKDWKVESPKVGTTMATLVKRFDKPVMIVEIGHQYDQPAQARAMLTDMIRRTRAIGPMGRGVVYWEPGTIPTWSGYRLGATNREHQLTEAMAAFRH